MRKTIAIIMLLSVTAVFGQNNPQKTVTNTTGSLFGVPTYTYRLDSNILGTGSLTYVGHFGYLPPSLRLMSLSFDPYNQKETTNYYSYSFLFTGVGAVSFVSDSTCKVFKHLKIEGNKDSVMLKLGRCAVFGYNIEEYISAGKTRGKSEVWIGKKKYEVTFKEIK